MFQQLSTAPVWIQVLAALGIFFLVVLPIIGSLFVVSAKGIKAISRKINTPGSPESELLTTITTKTSVFARALSCLLMLSLFTLWTAVPLYAFISPLILELLRSNSENTIVDHAIASATIALLNCIIIEIIVRRIPSATKLWMESFGTLPRHLNLSATSLNMLIRILGLTLVSLVAFEVSTQ